MNPKFLLLFTSTLLLGGAASETFAAAADAYQVTGPILAIDAKTIVVEKNHERWEIARDEHTKTDAALKVGDKVTVHYRMHATSIENKTADVRPAADAAPRKTESSADRKPKQK